MAETSTSLNPPAPTLTPSEVVPVAYHAIIDCANCELDKIQNVDTINQWLSTVKDTLGLTFDQKPTVTKTNVGYSVLQLFGTDSIDILFIDDKRQLYLDVFRLTEFDPVKLEETLKQSFGTTMEIKKVLLPRNSAV